MIHTTTEKIVKRFLNKVDDTGICWVWKGAKTGDYGRFAVTSDHIMTSHRFSYGCFVDNIPEGYDIHHVCKNKLCVNPAHLQAVSKKEHGRLDLKTHCKYKHEFTPENTYKRKGKRWCKICARNRYKEVS